METSPDSLLSTGRKLARNTLWNAVSSLWQGLALLALVPYIVHRVGLESYGIWVVLTAVVSYFDLADVTGKITLGKFVAQYHALGDRESLASALDSGALFYAALVSLIVALGLLFGAALLHVLQIPIARQDEARLVFNLALVAFCLMAMSNVWASVLAGLQRLDILTSISSVATALKLGATVWVLQSGWDLRGLAIVEVGAAGVSLLGLMICARKIYPPLRVRPWKFDGAMMKRIAVMGAQLNLSSAAEIIQLQLDKLLLSRFLGVQFVAYYDIGTRLIKYLRGFLLGTASSLTPVAAEMTAHGQHARLQRLYRTCAKAMALLAVGSFGALFLTAPQVLVLWVGEAFPLSVGTMRILCVAYAFSTLTGVGFFISNGAGRPEFQARTAPLQTVLNIAFSGFLFWRLGFYGAPLGTALAMGAGALYFLATWGRAAGVSLAEFLREVAAKPLFAALAAALAVSLASARVPVPDSRSSAFFIIMVETLVFSVLYLLLLKACRLWTREEKSSLQRHLPPRLRGLTAWL